MISGKVLLFLTLIFLGSILFALVQAEGGIKPTLEQVSQFGIPTPKPPKQTPLPAKETADPFSSGNSRFSQGRCVTDQQCITTGCSGEVCTSKGELTTTCEFSASFPNNQGLTCGCVNHVCGWE